MTMMTTAIEHDAKFGKMVRHDSKMSKTNAAELMGPHAAGSVVANSCKPWALTGGMPTNVGVWDPHLSARGQQQAGPTQLAAVAYPANQRR